jgi:predicted DNA-binding transcriptional regulator AlpA
MASERARAARAAHRESILATVHPVGLVEVADLLDVERHTVDRWRERCVMPAPRWTVGGRPAWERADILAWAIQTGRMARPDLEVSAVDLVGEADQLDLLPPAAAR